MTKPPNNKIPPGYKQTEVGVIPEDWQINKIQKISDVKSGKRIPKGLSLTRDKTDHPYIRVSDMTNKGIDMSEIQYVPDDVFPKISQYRIYCDDIYISVAGTLGLVGKIPGLLNGANLTENANRFTNISCDQDYLAFYLKSNLIQNKINDVKTLGAQPKLALTRIRDFEIALPSIKKEQTAIANVLSDVDALIEKLEKLIAKKRAIKQGAMQELLTGKRRLPGFSGEWEVKSLEECGNIKMGQSPPGDSYSSNSTGLPLLNGAADLREDGILITQYTTKSTRTSKKGDLLFCIRATIGNLQVSDKEYCLGRGVSALTVNANFNREFIAYKLQELFEFMRLQSQGGVIKGLRKDELGKMEINIPSTADEQASISKILTGMDKEIDSLEKELKKYRQIKIGMMQVLLTGKIRLA